MQTEVTGPQLGGPRRLVVGSRKLPRRLRHGPKERLQDPPPAKPGATALAAPLPHGANDELTAALSFVDAG